MRPAAAGCCVVVVGARLTLERLLAGLLLLLPMIHRSSSSSSSSSAHPVARARARALGGERGKNPGDWTCIPLQLKHLANAEARIVSHNLLNPYDLRAVDERVVPHAVFSHPQVGSVGVREVGAQTSGTPYVVGRYDYAGTAYGWALDDVASFAKVLVDPGTLQLLGGHVIGPQAATLLQQLVQAMAFEIPVDRLARGQLWTHPGLAEVLENALLDALRKV